jgi:hypothetical protein
MRVASSRVPRTLVPAPDEGILRRLAERKDVPNLRATPSTASKTELKYMIRRNSPSVTTGRPSSSCRATTWPTGSSSSRVQPRQILCPLLREERGVPRLVHAVYLVEQLRWALQAADVVDAQSGHAGFLPVMNSLSGSDVTGALAGGDCQDPEVSGPRGQRAGAGRKARHAVG